MPTFRICFILVYNLINNNKKRIQKCILIAFYWDYRYNKMDLLIDIGLQGVETHDRTCIKIEI